MATVTRVTELAKQNEMTLEKLSTISETLHKIETNQAVANENLKNFHHTFEQHKDDDIRSFTMASAERKQTLTELAALDKWKSTLQGQMMVGGAVVSVLVSLLVLGLSHLLGL